MDNKLSPLGFKKLPNCADAVLYKKMPGFDVRVSYLKDETFPERGWTLTLVDTLLPFGDIDAGQEVTIYASAPKDRVFEMAALIAVNHVESES